MMITRIEDKNGNILASFQPQKNEAISEQTAYLMINLMEGVINQGTGIRLRYRYNLSGKIAGKTGTTQNHPDGWFMGITPNIVGGAWVGAEDRGVRFRTIGMGQGANMALPIFALFLEKLYRDPNLGITPNDDWSKPLRLHHQTLDCPEMIQTGNDQQEVNEDDFF
jgi:penicillin-binding protein 1A